MQWIVIKFLFGLGLNDFRKDKNQGKQLFF